MSGNDLLMAISRRAFLIGSGLVGGGLALGLSLGKGQRPIPGTIAGSFQPNAWLQITSDNRVLFHLHKAEMGQGVITSLPMIIGEELDFAPGRFEVLMAGVHPDYRSPNTYTQITGGSTSVSESWDTLRHAGASARAMLIGAAAQRWQVPVEQCRTEDGMVIDAENQRRLSYGELADAARQFPDAPYDLKPRSAYRWIGRDHLNLDSVSKSTGAAKFGVDVELDGMKTAVIVRCPHFGGTLKSWQPESVQSLDGVVSAFPMHAGIAIVADSYWQARKAANQLRVEWDKGPLAGLDSQGILAAQQEALETKKPRRVVKSGDVDALFSSSASSSSSSPERTIQARYSVPYAHHSPMEPQNATAIYYEESAGNRCEVWAPNQAPDICRALIAHYGEVSRDNAIIHSTLMGGGFGRRGYPDYVGEVVAIARQLPGTPVKLMWSREDDMRHDYYRPSSLHALAGHLDEQGRLAGWRHDLVTASLLRGFGANMMSAVLPDWVPLEIALSLGKTLSNTFAGFDPTAADGADIPYDVPNIAVGQIEYDPGIPVGFWRSVGYSANVFVIESFMDELSHLAGKDPLAFRLEHLANAPRHRAVLELAAQKAGWGEARAGIGQGLAVSEPFRTFCAMVAEVSVRGREYTVERVVATVDCGLVVSPGIVKSQIESGIVYGLSAAMKAPVTFRDGRAEQSNFHDLPVLRINEVPKMEVYIVPSEHAPTGVGEIGVPPVAAAVANALFAATGQRLREMPLRLG